MFLIHNLLLDAIEIKVTRLFICNLLIYYFTIILFLLDLKQLLSSSFNIAKNKMNKIKLNEQNDETFKLNPTSLDIQNRNEETSTVPATAAAEAAASTNDSKRIKRRCLRNLFALCVSYLVQFSAYVFPFLIKQ